MAARGRLVAIWWRWPARGPIRTLAMLTALSAAASAEAVVPERSVSVLLMYAENRLLPATVAQDEAFRATLQAGLPHGVFFHTEHLDPAPLPASMQAALVELLGHKYRGRPIDLVVASTSVGLRFVLRHRAQLFPDVPVVFMAVNQAAAADLDLSGNVTGTWQSIDWAGTLDLALRLQPGTRRVVVVTGTADRDQIWLAVAREQLAPYRDRLEIQHLPAPSLSEMVQELARLPADTVVLFGTFHQDGTGHNYVSADVARHIAKAASAAVYGPFETYVGRGIVGGRVLSPAAQAQQREFLDRGQELPHGCLRRHEQEGPVDQVVEVGVRGDVGPLVRVGTQVEHPRNASSWSADGSGA